MKQFGLLVCMVMALSAIVTVCPTRESIASGHGADITSHKSCRHCGMDREKFAHSRMLIEFEDGTVVATCSLHCVAVDLATTIDKTPKSLKVGDYATKQLLDAEKATWVIGGVKPGVMTKNAKWAFAAKGTAEAFVRENGGKLATFDEAIKAAYDDMYTDTKMIRDKRKMMKKKLEGQPRAHDMKH